MRISILEAKFVRKKCALYTGKYEIEIATVVLYSTRPTPIDKHS